MTDTNYTAEQVRNMSEYCREHFDQAVLPGMLTAYAADLERREAGVTDEPAVAGGGGIAHGPYRGGNAGGVQAESAQPADSASSTSKPPQLGGCCCGEPCTLGVVHRTDGPCFAYTQPADSGRVTDAMVIAACMANLNPLAEPSSTEMRNMRAALEAALAAQPADSGRVTDAMVGQIINRVARENSADGMDGDSWDRLLVRAALAAQGQPASPAVVPDEMVVPYGSASGKHDYTYGYEKGTADGWNKCRLAMLAAAAPSAQESQPNG